MAGNDSYTKLLLPFDGIDGSKEVLDYGNTGHVVTNNGANFSSIKKFGDGVAYFNGSSDYVSVSDSDDWNFGSGDFTIDCWVKKIGGLGSYTAIIAQNDSSASDISKSFFIRFTNNNKLLFGIFSGTTEYNILSTNSYIDDAWYHIAGVRNGSNLVLYVNGESVGTTSVSTVSVNNSSNAVSVGRFGEYNGQYFNGYIDEVRVSKGIARWTSNFTPPTSAHTSDTYTKLLLHFDNDTDDSSNSSHSVTNNGVDIIASPKFGTSSLQFNGTSDYVSVPDSDDWNFGSGEFTLDCWIRPSSDWSNGTYGIILSQSASTNEQRSFYLMLLKDSDNYYLTFLYSTTGITKYKLQVEVTDFDYTKWNFIAFVRDNNTGRLYLNGTQIGTINMTGHSLYNSNVKCVVGALDDSNIEYFDGWIDEVRISKGIARWTSNFTPPTSAHTSDTYTKLLLHCDSPDIGLGGSYHDVTFNGTAQLDTAQKKFGTACVDIRGAKNISIANHSDWNFGSEDFTIDFWVYIVTAGGNGDLYALPSASGFSILCRESGGNIVFQWYDGTGNHWEFSTSSPLSTETWHHIAFVRNSSTIQRFVDGTLISYSYNTVTGSIISPNGSFIIGAENTTGLNGSNSYIDEFRVSKGIARWTSNFTPPTKAYNDKLTRPRTRFQIIH